MEDIPHAGVSGVVGNTFDGERWSLHDVVNDSSNQVYHAAVSALQIKRSTTNVTPPSNPPELIALVSAGLEHRDAALNSATDVVYIKSQFSDSKTLLEAFASG